QGPEGDRDQKLRAACALALFAPQDERWDQVRREVAETLVIQKPLLIADWTEAFKGAGAKLMPPLADLLENENRDPAELAVIASIYGTYADDLPGAMDRLERHLVEQA